MPKKPISYGRAAKRLRSLEIGAERKGKRKRKTHLEILAENFEKEPKKAQLSDTDREQFQAALKRWAIEGNKNKKWLDDRAYVEEKAGTDSQRQQFQISQRIHDEMGLWVNKPVESELIKKEGNKLKVRLIFENFPEIKAAPTLEPNSVRSNKLKNLKKRMKKWNEK